MFIAALFTTAKTQKQSKRPSTAKWIQMRCTDNAIRPSPDEEGTKPFAIRSHRPQLDYHTVKSVRRRQTPHDVTYTWNLRYDADELIHDTETDSCAERTDGVAKGEGLGRDGVRLGSADVSFCISNA